jgi:hypothetical protein
MEEENMLCNLVGLGDDDGDDDAEITLRYSVHLNFGRA